MNRSDILISVVVPVYNAEKTLVRCLNSILAQADARLEVILVDDGSQDASGEICQSYAASYSEVTLISQTNRGISEARNAGLNIARGEYISFIDSDDYVLPGFFSNLLTVAKSYDADVCCCGFTKVLNGKNVRYSLADEPCLVPPFDYLRDMLFGSLAGYAWNRLYRKRALDSLHFEDSSVGALAEDLLFNCALWNLIERVVYAPSCLYCYVVRDGSLSNAHHAGIKDGIWLLDAITSDVKKMLPKSREVSDLLNARDAQNAFNELLVVSGIREYDWIRPRLISMVRDNYSAYCRFEKSIIKRIAYRLLPLLPSPVLGAIAKIAGLRN